MQALLSVSELSLIQSELDDVNMKIGQIFAKAPNNLRKTLKVNFAPINPGLGAILLLLAASRSKLKGKKRQNITDLATSISLLQMSVSIHRNLNHDSTKNKDSIIYSGDFLLTEFFDLVIQAIKDEKFLIKNANTIQKLVDSQIFALTQLTNASYKKIRANLAAQSQIFALASEEGAYFSNPRNKNIKTIAEIGAMLGINWEILQLSNFKFQSEIDHYRQENKEKADLLLSNLPQTENILVLKKINQRLSSKKICSGRLNLLGMNLKLNH